MIRGKAIHITVISLTLIIGIDQLEIGQTTGLKGNMERSLHEQANRIDLLISSTFPDKIPRVWITTDW